MNTFGFWLFVAGTLVLTSFIGRSITSPLDLLLRAFS